MPADLQRNQGVYNSMSEAQSGREGGQRSSQGSDHTRSYYVTVMTLGAAGERTGIAEGMLEIDKR